MAVDPSVQTVAAGETVTVKVTIEGATDLSIYAFVLEWDPAVLGFMSVTNGPFLGSTGRTVTCGAPAVGADSVGFGCTTTGLAAGPDGEGVLATIEFVALAPGDSPVTFSSAGAADTSGVAFTVVTADGLVSVETPTATPTVTPTLAPTLTPTATPVSITLSPSGDAPVRMANPDSPFPLHPQLNISGDNSALERGFVAFDVTSVPSGATVLGAQLTLCLTSLPSGGASGHTHELRRPLAAWDETTLTWNNQPAVAGVSATAIVPDTVTCVAFDVTSDVQSWIDGSSSFGWRVSDADESTGNSSEAIYGSRDGTEATRPYLDVTYIPP
jgi:hypothetical protein